MATRNAPRQLSRYVAVGEEGEGEDGRVWVVVRRSNGTHVWMPKSTDEAVRDVLVSHKPSSGSGRGGAKNRPTNPGKGRNELYDDGEESEGGVSEQDAEYDGEGSDDGNKKLSSSRRAGNTHAFGGETKGNLERGSSGRSGRGSSRGGESGHNKSSGGGGGGGDGDDDVPCALRVTLFNANAKTVEEVVRVLAATVSSATTDVVVFPESFVTEVVDPGQKIGTYSEARSRETNARMMIVAACMTLGVDCVICGRDYKRTHIYNSAWYINKRGEVVHKYDKQNIVERDAREGNDGRFITKAGKALNSEDVSFLIPCPTKPECMIKAAILICADLEDPRIVAQIRAAHPAIVFNPASCSANVQTEAPELVDSVEGAKQEVEKLLRGASNFELYRTRLENAAENEHELEAARRARGGVAHDAFVVRTDYPFPGGAGGSMILKPTTFMSPQSLSTPTSTSSSTSIPSSFTSPSRNNTGAKSVGEKMAETKRTQANYVKYMTMGRIAWQGTWDRVWIPTVALDLDRKCKLALKFVHPRSYLEHQDEQEEERELTDIVEEAVATSGPPPPPPDFIFAAPPPAPDFEDHPAHSPSPPPISPPSLLLLRPSTSPSPSPHSRMSSSVVPFTAAAVATVTNTKRSAKPHTPKEFRPS
jgi:predicted amidohydrolase